MGTTKFDSLLASADGIGIAPFGYEKVAGGIESPDQGQLEQDFARLAYMFVQDRAPALIKYLLGFEVVQREPDGSKAVGIFGFKMGKDYYYVPAFFLNNQIKGVDLLYAKRTNMFMPLTEDWINFIINRHTIELGEGADGSNIQRHFEAPNFSFLAAPPVGAKVASVLDSIESGYDAWNFMQQSTAAQLEKDSEFQKAVAGFLAKCAHEELPFEKSAEGALVPFLENHGGPKAVEGLLKALSNLKYANAALEFYPDVKSLAVTDFSESLAPKTAEKKVEVLTSVPDCECGISPEVKKRFVRDGFAVDDKRKPEEKSKTYNVDYSKSYSCPTEPGLYHVLLNTGETVEAWVLMASGAASKNVNVVVHKGNGLYRLAEDGATYAMDDMIEPVKSIYKEAIPVKDMELNQPYLLVNEKGNCTRPVEVTSVISVDGERIRLKIWMPYTEPTKRPQYGRDFSTLHSMDTLYKDDRVSEAHPDYIELSPYKGDTVGISSDRNTLILPANWKAYRLEHGISEKDDYSKKQALREAFKLGSLNDLEDTMQKLALHRLTVASDDRGLEYYFTVNDTWNTRPMSYKTAYVNLVKSYGLPVDDTEAMLKEAAASFKSRRLIKLAQMPASLVGVNMPYPQEQAPEIDPYTGVPIYPAQEQFVQGSMTGVPPKPLPYQYGVNLGGEAEMDTQAMQAAQQAADAGQKQIFDHASIGGLAKTYDTSAVIDSYIPELMKSLDRLGRLIFMFYWKNEDFAERYGTNDITEMEDLIRGVFKSFGELVLDLRKKAVNAEDSAAASM